MKTSYIAHGKVILIGEHSVVYGYDALALPIKSLNIKTSIEPASGLLMDTKNYQGPFYEAPSEYDGLKYVVKTLLNKAQQKNAKIKISYRGEIPIERGLGSSATVALGTSKALNQYFNLNLSEAQIMKITNHAEMINHGKASGLDAATVHSDYLVYFNSKTGPKKLAQKLNATLLIMDTGQLGNTKEAVEHVRKLYDSSKAYQAKIEKLGVLTKKTKEFWLKQDKEKVGQIFNEAQELLSDFDLSTEKIDRLKDLASTHNCLGFKLSGGGLGGVVICLCQDRENAQTIAKASSDLINNYWIEEI